MSFSKKMNHCFVIGGAGFIGSQVVRKLLKRDRKVTVIGRTNTPDRKLPKRVEYISSDCSDRKFLQEVLCDADEIIDLAYSTVPKTSYDKPVRDVMENLPLAVNLFETASSLNLKKIVLISSGGTIYGKALKIPIDEKHPTNPISPYGISKLATEKYALMYHELKKLPVVCVRPGNAYGIGQRPFVGQGFIATAIASIIKKKEVLIYGDSGTIRDYIYVTDVAEGIVSVLEKGTIGAYYNIGTGVGRSNKDILDLIRTVSGSNKLGIKVRILPQRHFDVPINVLDCRKIENDTGWKPSVSFEEGMEKTWKWLCDQKILIKK